MSGSLPIKSYYPFKMRLRRRLLWIPVLAVVIAGIFVTRFSLGSHASSMPADMGEVERSDLLQQVTVAGTVLPNRRSMLTPPYNAYVKKLYVHLGQLIQPGDPVITLVQSLRGDDEDLHPMRAPFAGQVVQILHTEGEYVETAKEGNGMVRIDDLSKLFVVSDVPESDIQKIRTGQEVLVKINSILTHPYHGRIREIALAAKEKKEWSRSADRVEFEVRIELMDRDPQVHPGMSCIVDIITDKRDQVLTLPHEFIEKRKDKYFATLQNGEKREISIGLQNEDKFEIVSGLKENERVKKVDFASLPEED